MSLVILEGLDRTGKSSVADHYKSLGFEIVHQSAPAKNLTPDLYLEEQLRVVASAASRNIVLDRSYYGELVWPEIYSRTPLLSDEGLEPLRELEESVGVTRILMHDPNIEAHWQRCVDNKEPLTKAQFTLARRLFQGLAEKYGFTRKTLSDFSILPTSQRVVPLVSPSTREPGNDIAQRTPEQAKLDTANAINTILSKRIVKPKGPIYDHLESKIRDYLNAELGTIFGTKVNENTSFTTEEVELLKFFCGKLKEGKR